jgi:hypothetical protein
LEPATTLVEPVLVVLMSACGVTPVTTLAAAAEPLLLEATGSLVTAVLEVVLVKLPPAGAVTVTVKLVEEP